MSKIKLLVEIDEDNYKAICSDKGYSYANTMWWIIRNGTPYNPSGDLISREALKEDIMAYKTMPEIRKAICEVIDNAPSVPQVTVFTENADEKAVADMKAELQSVIGAIPKGVWTTDENGYFYCDRCGRYPHDQYATTDFCPKCGADMRKGGAE